MLHDDQPGRMLAAAPHGQDPAHLLAPELLWTEHAHPEADLLVVVLRGHGAMRIGDEERPVGPGSILWVPRGVQHAFRNAAPEPAAAYAVLLR